MSFTLEDFSCYVSVRNALTLIFVFFVSTVSSRLLFHPLKIFPGPHLARVTELYAAYYELWKDGHLVIRLKELHDIYGSFALAQYPLSC